MTTLIDRPRTALVVIDVQNGVMAKPTVRTPARGTRPCETRLPYSQRPVTFGLETK
jgi:hypothetical protein